MLQLLLNSSALKGIKPLYSNRGLTLLCEGRGGSWAGSGRKYMHLAILLINPKGLLALRIFISSVGGRNKISKHGQAKQRQMMQAILQ